MYPQEVIILVVLQIPLESCAQRDHSSHKSDPGCFGEIGHSRRAFRACNAHLSTFSSMQVRATKENDAHR